VLRKRPSKKAAETANRGKRRGVLSLAASDGEAVLPRDARGHVEATEEARPLDPLLAYETLGEALKAIRHDKGLTLQEVAEITRVRRSYLEALEEMRLDELPSRPFTIGYIRAYAIALGLQPDAATERFKTEEPILDEPLRAPIGVPDEKDPRVAAFLIGALVIVAAIVLWNVAQRAMIAGGPPPPLAPESFTNKALSQMKAGPVDLGAPLPAPVESTTPPPYETPGLAEAMGLKTDPAAQANRPKPANEPAVVDITLLPKTFTPAGKVYDAGNPQLTSVVTLQALKPASLIIRGADGSVYFARQLSKGEAFRVPQLAGLTLDVSNANDFHVFVYGQSKGVLPAPQVLASKLVTNPDPATVAAPARPAAPAPAPPAPRPPAP